MFKMESCKNCKKEYTKHPNLSRHLKKCGITKEMINKKTVHECEVCSKHFDRKSKLDRHKGSS